ncbi:MAG: DNA polymerase III subunit delta', partial [Chroococcales cyanobacterium]
LLKQAVEKNRIAPAYLFTGYPGIGRKLAAKCFIELLFCSHVAHDKHSRIKKQLELGNHPDIFWVQPTYLHQGKRLTVSEATEAGLKRKSPPQIRVEQIREITQFLSRPPLEASRAIVVIEDAQTMAEGAANALLKTLEEPGKATLILIAPGVDSLLPTLVSRCQRIPFYPLSFDEMKQVLQQTGHEDIVQDSVLLAIAQGSPGEAISSWQQRQEIPQDLLEKLTSTLNTQLNALLLAKEVDKTLDTEAQLWLLDYLQYSYWKKVQHPKIIQVLETAKKALLSYAQPRLVWEVTLLELSQVS